MKECTTIEALLKPLTSNLIGEAVKRFNADYYCKTFKSWDHLIVLMYSQLHGLKSLRDLEIAFNSQKKLKSLIECKGLTRSTLSDANFRRDASCFLWIVEQLMRLLPRKKHKEVNRIVKKLDSSPIQLKGKGYDEWTKGNCTLRCQGLKLHVEYDGQLSMPTGVKLSAANVDDCSMGQRWAIESDTIYIFDKGYYDFNWWWSIKQKQAFFVTRLKHNAAIKVIEERTLSGSHEKILGDSLFEFKNKNPRGGKKNNYTEALRQVVVKREGKEKPLILVTNLMDISAEIIGELYKERWGIELFFKWIKQNLRIKKFLGKSENAVKTQIAIALIVYLLMGIFKLNSKNKLSLHQLFIWIQHNFDVRKNIYKLIKVPEYSFQQTNYLKYSGGNL